MTRRRYIQDPKTLELIEVSADYVPDMTPDSGALWGDRHYDGLRATDGTDISTRTKQREYMRRRGLADAGDFKGEWNQAATRRADFFEGRDPTRKGDVCRAISQLKGK